MLLDYDTIILDLDFNIWDGCRPRFWARFLEPPYALDHSRFYGASGEYIDFHDDISEVLQTLYDAGKNISFASRGEADNKPYDEQPSIIALKMFGIYDYFNYQKILVHRTINKATLLKPVNNTIYIDDTEDELKNVTEIFGNSIQVLNRNTFNNWRSILYE